MRHARDGFHRRLRDWTRLPMYMDVLTLPGRLDMAAYQDKAKERIIALRLAETPVMPLGPGFPDQITRTLLR